jgi:uncharacterized membrane protein
VTRTGMLSRALLAAFAVVVVAVLAALPASADPPPAAVGSTIHGFLAEDGVITAIDHPDATTIPATPLAAAGTSTSGINDSGEILGIYEDADRVLHHFVRDRKGRFNELDDPPGGADVDEYLDINNRGEIIGTYNDEQGFNTTAFLRSKRGRFTSIEVPDSEVTYAFKLNDRRQVVGLYLDADAEPNPDSTFPPGLVHGFLWDDGEYTTIDVRGAAQTFVTGINNRGEMVGSYVDADGDFHGFRRDKRGAVTTLPEAPGADPTMGGTQPLGINDHGQIVGLAYDARGGSRGFLLERGVLTMFDGTPEAVFTRPFEINNRGQIVGEYGTRPPVAARSSSGHPADRPAAPGLSDSFGLDATGLSVAD